MTKKALIIGGTGFIGYHLSKKCLKNNYSVTSISQKKPVKLRYLKKVKYIFCDISKKKKLYNKLKKKNFDIVVNLGGYVDHSKKIKTYKSHYIGCKNLIDYFVKKNPKKFVQIGSSLEYGNLPSPQKEKYKTNLNNLKSTYSIAKLKATRYSLYNFKKKNFPIVVFRLYLTYGPLQDLNRLIPIVINNCLKNESFNTSYGNQLRDFLYIDELVNLIFKSFNNKKINGKVINVGSGKPVKIKFIINFIHNYLKKGKPIFGGLKLRKDEQLKIFPNNNLLKKYFKWSPNISIKKGLVKTINYYKKNT